MTVVLMKETTIGKIATLSTRAAADALVSAGKARQDPTYPDLYEEVTDGEVTQGYMTRNMMALPPKAAARRTPKPPAGGTTPHGTGGTGATGSGHP